MKFTPGPTIAAASGSIGGTVYSHNRGGMYTRNRSIPITSSSSFALNAKQRLATASQDWQSLTDAQRFSWANWALQNPVTDALGFPRHLSGHQAFTGLNARRAGHGDASLNDPPIVPAPDGLLTLVLTADIGTGDVEIAFTATPLGANTHLDLEAAVTNSPGITNVNNLLKCVVFSADAQASPFVFEADLIARLGTLVVGQKVFVRVSVYDTATGQKSLPLTSSAVVIST